MGCIPLLLQRRLLTARLLGAPSCSQDEGDALAYQLRVNLTCQHVEHTDSASFDALVLLGADGSTQVSRLFSLQ